MNSTPSNTLHVAFIPANLFDPIKIVQITSDLSSMYPIIGCDIVEPVALDTNYKSNLWVDEEALCKANPIINLRASCLAGRPVYGNAIFAGEKMTEDGPEIDTLCIPCPKIFFDLLQQEAIKIFDGSFDKAS